jgi:hypothetical protein
MIAKTKKRVIIALIVTPFAVFAVGTIGAVISARSSPIVLRVGDGPAAFENDSAEDILNPFRDRGPEKPALAILHKVKAGHCAEVDLGPGDNRPDPQCEEDTKLRLISWRLRAREDDTPEDSILYYEVERDFGPNGIKWGDPYWFIVKRQPDGQWKVVSLERWF